jgi:hypothetical protein
LIACFWKQGLATEPRLAMNSWSSCLSLPVLGLQVWTNMPSSYTTQFEAILSEFSVCFLLVPKNFLVDRNYSLISRIRESWLW